MEMTRKEFLGSIAGATALAAASSATGAATAAEAPKKAKFKRGVSLYSYVGDFGSSMSLEDCLMEMDDMGAHSLEILNEAHIPDYPNPSNAWVDHWYKMLDKYRITPAFYCCWLENNNSPQEQLDHLLRDMRLAHRLGFKRIGPKVNARSDAQIREGPGFGPKIDPKWEEWVLRVLPYAEKLDVRVRAGEIHSPTLLSTQWVQDVVAFLQKNPTPYFGLHIDTGIFATRPERLGDQDFESDPAERAARGPGAKRPPRQFSQPEELLPLLPYTIHFHFKFWEMLDDFTEYSIPFDRIVAVLIEGGYDAHATSEYEGPRTQGLASLQLRRQHVMLKRLMGEYASV